MLTPRVECFVKKLLPRKASASSTLKVGPISGSLVKWSLGRRRDCAPKAGVKRYTTILVKASSCQRKREAFTGRRGWPYTAITVGKVRIATSMLE